MTDKPLKVLVVEDDPDDIELIRAELERASGAPAFEVESVARLSAAVDRLAQKDVDVVLLDLGLPDAVGLAGVARLGLESPETPVVVLTGTDDEAVGLRAVQEGAQDYLVKGHTDGALLQRSLRFAIERRRAEKALARLAAVMGALCYECGRKLSSDPFAGRFQH